MSLLSIAVLLYVRYESSCIFFDVDVQDEFQQETESEIVRRSIQLHRVLVLYYVSLYYCCAIPVLVNINIEP